MKIPMFDAHCDTISRCLKTGENFEKTDGQLDLERLQEYHPCAQVFAIFSDMGKPGPDGWTRYQMQYALFCRQMEQFSDRIMHCRTAEEARCAQEQGKVAAFLSVEGAELLSCNIQRLQEAYRAGVRIVHLTWNYANALSGSHSQESHCGLTQQGCAFVCEMQRLGMIIDVSHLSDAGVWDVLELSSGPIIASHSNAREVFFHTRNLTDDQITAIIKRNGVIGLNLYPPFLGEDPDLDTVIAHLEHIWALGGEKTAALGGDWDGTQGHLPRKFHDVTGWKLLYEELLRRNYSQALIDNLFFNNMMRVVKEVCGT